MRVIAGQFRSRVLVAPRGSGTRPTSDRLRETLFNVLGSRVEDSRFADLYAGSGAVGMEALSRGAASCVLVERAPVALVAMKKNIAALGLGGKVAVEARAVLRMLQDLAEAGRPFDLVFLDPPYEAEAEYTGTLRLLAEQHLRLLAPEAVVVAEHAKRSPLPESFGQLRRYRLLTQGDAALSFYSVERAAGEDGL